MKYNYLLAGFPVNQSNGQVARLQFFVAVFTGFEFRWFGNMEHSNLN
jgi:hypothetical protein